MSCSRAIMCYLVEKYAKDDSLYPKDPKKRAKVNHKLFFDATSLYQGFINYYVSKINLVFQNTWFRIAFVFICLKRAIIVNINYSCMWKKSDALRNHNTGSIIIVIRF
jgi:hypothetical protein